MFAARNGFQYSTPEEIKDSVVVLIGCGPVALCALLNITDYNPKKILAVDSVPSRLELAKSLGAEPWNFQTDREGLDKRVGQGSREPMAAGRGRQDDLAKRPRCYFVSAAMGCIGGRWPA